jgi:hypothetical protein
MFQGKRRFWIIAVVVTTIAGAATALTSIVLHYTQQGDNPFGCTSQRLKMGLKKNTNQYCTREMAACSFLPKYLQASKRGDASIACNEIVSISVS